MVSHLYYKEIIVDLDKLKNRDYYVVVDKSGSMTTTDTPTGQSRFKYAEESTNALARKLSELDPDGITVIPFSSSFKVYDGVTPDQVANIFKENEPMGGTVLAPVLKKIFEMHLAKKKAGTEPANGALVCVITDGQPSDEQDVAKAIVDFTKKLENGDDEFGITFLQVGKDPAAHKFLTDLDDHLTDHGAKYDIVDTKTMEELENIGLTEALLAALND